MKFKQVIHMITSWRYFLWSIRVLAPTLLALGLTMYTHYQINTSSDRDELLIGERHNIKLMQDIMSKEISYLVTDLRLLHKNLQLQLFKNNPASAPFETPLSHNKAQLIQQFIAFSNVRRVYDQIRVIGLDGMELIRVNSDITSQKQNGQAFSVPTEALQNKADRYYFKDIVKTQKDNVYISPLDLNVEQGTIEYPQKPALRLGAPIYNLDDELIGVLVLNYNGFHLLDHFIRSADQLSDNIMLVAPNGFWVISPQSAERWTYMARENQSFAKIHSQVWPQIESSRTQQLANSEGIYTFTTIDNQEIGIETSDKLVSAQAEKANYHWKIVSFIDQGSLFNIKRRFIERNSFFYFFTFILSVFATILITYWRTKHRHSVEQVLFESHFKHSLENIQLAAITLDQQGKLLFCNRHFIDKLKLQQQPTLNCDWVEWFVNDSEKNKVKNLLSKMQTSQSACDAFDCHLKNQNGELLCFNWNATVAVDAVGEFFGITLIGKDVTLENEITLQLRKLSAAVEQSPNVVMITGLDGRIEYVNPKLTQLTGYTLEELKGRTPSALKSGETRPEEYDELWKTITQGKSWRGVFHNKKKSGELYWEAAHISPLRDEQGIITHYLALKEDITRQRILEKEVAQKNNELIKNRELASVGKMANMVAHDIRNPLSIIKVGLLIQSSQTSRPTQPELDELAQISLEQINYMEEIISDLLSFSRPDDLRCQWINIENLINTTLTSLHRIIISSKVTIVQDIPKGLPTILIDPVKMRQVLSNLIQNAIQATESNSGREPMVNIEASLILGENGTGINICIRDNGCGIDNDHLDSVFEPFITNKAKGTGLGLAIVHRIIQQHQGSITLVNRKSGGVKANINLPLNSSPMPRAFE